jgi:transcriptional regulator with XRE-family HTH domain
MKYMGFRENLKAELDHAGLYVKELAALSGVKKQTIDSYLRQDGFIPTIETGVRIAQALGVSVEYLVTGSDSLGKSTQPYFCQTARLAARIVEELDKENRKLALDLLKTLKKHYLARE